MKLASCYQAFDQGPRGVLILLPSTGNIGGDSSCIHVLSAHLQPSINVHVYTLIDVGTGWMTGPSNFLENNESTIHLRAPRQSPEGTSSRFDPFFVVAIAYLINEP